MMAATAWPAALRLPIRPSIAPRRSAWARFWLIFHLPSRRPQLTHLRPTYPDASIAAAAFVRDGRLGLVIGLPAGGREAWLLDPAAGTLRRIGPPRQWAALAIAPDGARVAYLAASIGAPPATVTTQTLPGSSPNTRLDEVRVSGAERDAAPRCVLQLLQGSERLVDLSWSPDGQHLLLVTRQTLTLGGEQTRLLRLGLDGDTLAGAELCELLTLPGQVVPGSYTWEPGGRAVAFLVRPGTGPQTAVCLLEPATSAFRYLGDLVPDAGSSAAPTAAPWEASGSALYAVSAPPAASARDDTPLFGLRPMGGPRTTLGLFRARSPAGTDDEWLPSGDGTTGLAVRDDGMLLGLTRPNSDGPVVAMARPYFGSTYHDVMELVPRVLLGAVLANTSRDWCRLAIDFNNAFSDAIGNVTPPGFDQAPGAGQVLITVVSGLIYVVMRLLLALQMLMRFGLVDLLVVIAPLAMLCWVLPQTQGWARHWSALFTSTVFIQALQVLVLKLPRFMPGPSRGAGGVVTLLEAVAIGRALGVGGGRGGGSGRTSGGGGRGRGGRGSGGSAGGKRAS